MNNSFKSAQNHTIKVKNDEAKQKIESPQKLQQKGTFLDINISSEDARTNSLNIEHDKSKPKRESLGS